MKNNLNTEEDFRVFLKGYNIRSRVELNNRFYSIYKKFLALEKDVRDRLLPSSIVPIILNSLEDYEKFIKEHNISSRSQFYKNFPNVYKRFLRDISKEDQARILPKLKEEYDENASTYEYLKEFIEKNNIKSRTEFSSISDTVYKKFLKLSRKDQEELLPSSKFSKVKDFESFQKFIANNDITSRKDLDRRFSRLYVKFLEIFTAEEQEKLLPSNREDLSELVDYSGFLEFINRNNILSRRDFQERSTAGYHRFKTILSDEEQDLLLPITHTSVGEIFLMKLFDENELEFCTQKIFQNLLGKSNKPLRYDFYLPKYNILVEYHGRQHFDPEDNFYNEDAILRDKMKFEYAKSNDIRILYFTNEVEIYKKYGYFTEVITDSDILIQRIKEIGLTNQLNS